MSDAKNTVLTLPECARHLRISELAVLQYVLTGALPVAVLGEELLFFRPHLNNFVKRMAECMAEAVALRRDQAAATSNHTVRPHYSDYATQQVTMSACKPSRFGRRRMRRLKLNGRRR